MKIGFVGPVPPIRGGISQHSARVLEAIQQLGHGIAIHSWQSQYPGLLYRRPERDALAAAFPNVSWSLRWWNPMTWRTVGKDLQRVDRIIIPWTVPVHGPHYLSIMRIANVPVTVHVHNALPHEQLPASEWMARRVLGRADRLVTHSSSVAAVCTDLTGNRSVSVVPHPPDLPVIRRPLPQGPLRLLALGYLRDYKGTDLAIQAIARLAEGGDDVRLTVAGEPWDRKPEPWRDLVRRLRVEGRVTLRLEYQSDQDLAELLASHHALIAPYRSATQSGVVAQALAAGRPVVATRVGGIPDLVVDGKNGTLAHPDNVESLVDAIVRLKRGLPVLADGADRTRYSWRDVATALTGES